MNNPQVFEELPFWIILGGTVTIVLLSIKAGIYIGRFRKRRSGDKEERSLNTLVGATLGLLAFILAFTFGLTTSRFDSRKQLLLEEVNAIETTFLRADVIPEPHRSEVRRLLRKYVGIRVDLARHPENMRQGIKQSEELQGQMWSHATALAEADLKNPAIVSLFVDSLNKMFDLQTKRVTVGLVHRIPSAMWVVLFGLTILSMVGVGYLFGTSEKTNWFLILALSLAFSSVIMLIADLDRSGAGKSRIIQFSPQPLIDLQQRINGQVK